MEDKPLENRCHVHFKCFDIEHKPCSYKNDDGYCDYWRLGNKCTSSVAKVNAMVLEMKRMGVEIDCIK